MSQDALNRRCLDTRREQQGGAGVPQILHPHPAHLSFGGPHVEHAIHIPRFDRAAQLGREYQPARAPVLSRLESLLDLLLFAMRLEHLHQRRRERDGGVEGARLHRLDLVQPPRRRPTGHGDGVPERR
ncbi:MAG TPA: hypothetical protein VGP03_00595 [Pseudonocardiaceae bacterium]|nr:hypothetical protein [Pseudonocardiaceae bacterium]